MQYICRFALTLKTTTSDTDQGDAHKRDLCPGTVTVHRKRFCTMVTAIGSEKRPEAYRITSATQLAKSPPFSHTSSADHVRNTQALHENGPKVEKERYNERSFHGTRNYTSLNPLTRSVPMRANNAVVWALRGVERNIM